MRFQRGDLPGILIAALGPAAVMAIVAVGYDLGHHEGTPLLAVLATGIAVSGGLLAAFTRFIVHWRLPAALLALLLLDAAAVLVLQRTGDDGTPLATALKVLGVLLFLALNAVALFEIANEGLTPVIERREARIRAAGE